MARFQLPALNALVREAGADAEAAALIDDGALNVVHHQIEVTCPAQSIPEGFTFDLTGLEIGDAVHVSQGKLPKSTSL